MYSSCKACPVSKNTHTPVITVAETSGCHRITMTPPLAFSMAILL